MYFLSKYLYIQQLSTLCRYMIGCGAGRAVSCELAIDHSKERVPDNVGCPAADPVSFWNL